MIFSDPVPYLYSIQYFNHPRVSQGPKLAYRILSQRKSRFVCTNIKDKDTACRAIILNNKETNWLTLELKIGKREGMNESSSTRFVAI
jgi:hypothetical protein